MKNVVVIAGSLRKESINRKLAIAMAKLRTEKFTFTFAPIEGVPLYNQDLDTALPQGVVDFKAAIAAADAVLFVTPEYNRSIPGVLKNAIDWATRPRGQNSFAGKPVGIVGASEGRIGTAAAQSHLRSIVSMLGCYLMGSPEIYFQWQAGTVNAEGALTDPAAQELLGKYLDRFAEWIERNPARK